MRRTVNILLINGYWHINGRQVEEDLIECIYCKCIEDTADMFIDEINVIAIGDEYICLKCGYMGPCVEHNCGERRYISFTQYVETLSTQSVSLAYGTMYYANGNVLDNAVMKQLIGFDPYKRWLSQVIVTGKGATRIIYVCRACGRIISKYEAKRHIC